MSVPINEARNGTVTSVAASATSTPVLAANKRRVGGAIYNDSSAVLYLKFGATASTTSFTVLMEANAFYELPDWYRTGQVDGIWASATGYARVTEVV